MRKSYYTKQFKKDYKKAKKTHAKHFNLLIDVTQNLILEKTLDPKHKDHQLKGKYLNRRELHIKPDWLLIYKLETNKNGEKIIYFERIGSYANLF